MNDHDKFPDQARQGECARKLAELLKLLATIDHQLNPEHSAQLLREILEVMGDYRPPVLPARAPGNRMAGIGEIAVSGASAEIPTPAAELFIALLPDTDHEDITDTSNRGTAGREHGRHRVRLPHRSNRSGMI